MSTVKERLEKAGSSIGMPKTRVGAAAGGAAAGLAGLAIYKKLKKDFGNSEKKAGLAEYSVLFDKVASGDLGEHTRQALYGICQTIEAPATAEKTASVYDASDLSENDARKARLDQLLKR